MKSYFKLFLSFWISFASFSIPAHYFGTNCVLFKVHYFQCDFVDVTVMNGVQFTSYMLSWLQGATGSHDNPALCGPEHAEGRYYQVVEIYKATNLPHIIKKSSSATKSALGYILRRLLVKHIKLWINVTPALEPGAPRCMCF